MWGVGRGPKKSHPPAITADIYLTKIGNGKGGGKDGHPLLDVDLLYFVNAGRIENIVLWKVRNDLIKIRPKGSFKAVRVD